MDGYFAFASIERIIERKPEKSLGGPGLIPPVIVLLRVGQWTTRGRKRRPRVITARFLGWLANGNKLEVTSSNSSQGVYDSLAGIKLPG